MRQQIKVDGSWIDGAPQLGEWYKQEVATDVWQEQRFNPQNLSDAKSIAIAKINPEANNRISALDWKVTRASERQKRGRGNQADLDAVYDERENIRLASDAAIIAINALTTIEEVNAFTW